jgi:hypothetical protein
MKKIPLKKRKEREKSVEEALEMIESNMTDPWDDFSRCFRSHKEEGEKKDDTKEAHYYGSFWISEDDEFKMSVNGCVGKLNIDHCVYYFVWKHLWWCANDDEHNGDGRNAKELPFQELLRRVISNINAYRECIKYNAVLHSHRQVTRILMEDMYIKCKAIWFRPSNLSKRESSPSRDVLHDCLYVVFDNRWGNMLHELLNLNKPVTRQVATILGDTFIREIKKIHLETLHIMVDKEITQLFGTT